MTNDQPGQPRENLGLDELTRDECLRLLRTQYMGELGVAVAGYPLIFPLNYGLDGDVVVIRNRHRPEARCRAGHQRHLRGR